MSVVIVRGTRGEVVKQAQRLLVGLGFGLPRYGVDGSAGEEFFSAMNAFLDAYQGVEGVQLDRVVTARELQLLEDSWRKRSQARSLPAWLRDCRNAHPLPNPKHCSYRGFAPVTGVVLHQTACVLGESEQRWYTVPAHLGVTRGGKVLWLNGFDWNLPCANGFNGSTISIEIDGRYRGVEARPETLWNHQETAPTDPSAAQVEAAKQALRWVVEELRTYGCRVRYLFAHRQSSSTRESDPGEFLWKQVGIWGQRQLGLTDGGDGYKVGQGLAIPREWDPARTARY